MYYVVSEYCLEAECDLLNIKTEVSEDDHVVFKSEVLQDCEAYADDYHTYINEQFELAELNKG